MASLFPNKTAKSIQVGYVLALGLIALAAFCGALRFLELANSLTYHVWLTYLSKHLAMTFFVVFGLWPNLQSNRAKLFAKLLLLLSLTSCILNLKFQLMWLADVTIMSAILLAAHQVRSNFGAILAVMLGLALLISKPLWGTIIDNESLRIGINHLCLGIGLILLAKSLNSEVGHRQI